MVHAFKNGWTPARWKADALRRSGLNKEVFEHRDWLRSLSLEDREVLASKVASMMRDDPGDVDRAIAVALSVVTPEGLRIARLEPRTG